MPTWYNGGFICIDKHGKTYLKYGGNVVPISDMTVFDKMLVMACGIDETSKPNFPNLFYLKESRYQEKGAISGGSAGDETLSSEWPSAVITDKDGRILELERFLYCYKMRTTYQSTADAFVIKYKVNQGAWTTLITRTMEADGNTYIVSHDKKIKRRGKLWQFRFESDEDFELIWWKPFFVAEPLTPH